MRTARYNAADIVEFKRELAALLNKYSRESGSDTSDWILAEYLLGCLETFDETLQIRAGWNS